MTRRIVAWRLRWESCGEDGVWREICEGRSTVSEREARCWAALLREYGVTVRNVRLFKVWRNGR